jgi:hypothetical protein
VAGLERRVRKLEEVTQRSGFAGAIQRLDEEDAAVFLEYMLRWEAEGGERVAAPDPTPREAAMLRRLLELRRQCIAEGWDDASGYRAC